MPVAQEPLPEGLVADLSDAAAFPLDADAARGVEHVQTHISHVFLLERRVYKLRKSVDLGFVCFSARAKRNADCVDEVRLNRRLAADVYLGVAPVEAGPDGFRVGELITEPDALEERLEHCVVMRRLETGRDALSLLEKRALTREQLATVAIKIARFHASLAPVATQGAGDPTAPAQANLRAIESADERVVASADAASLRSATEAALAALAPAFERRRAAGRVVEGHGDLHLQHVWFPSADATGARADDPPIIDCLEFSKDLRVIDVAAEVAFLAMDLVYRGAGALGEAFLGRYALETDDYDLYSVIDFCVGHRAAIRGKVAALAAADSEMGRAQREHAATSAQRHVELARRALQPRPAGDVVLVGGVIGTGKSTVARAWAERTGAVVIASDRVRKASLGLAPSDRLSDRAHSGAYSPEARARVYEALLQRAAPVVASGRTVVLDATWSSGAMRARARALAAEHGARCLFVETRCDEALLRERLAARRARGDDPSDAGPELLDASSSEFEPVGVADTWPAANRGVIRTDGDGDGLDARIAALAEAFGQGAGSVWD